MSNNLQISYSKLESCYDQLNSVVQNMQTKLENTKSINDSIPNIWKGEAADSYLNKANSLTSSFQNISEQVINSINYIKKFKIK